VIQHLSPNVIPGNRRAGLLAATLVLTLTLMAVPANAQVGPGLADLNAVPEATLASMPGMTPAIAKAVVAARPFGTIVEAHTFLQGQKLTPEQLALLYEKAFVHLNLNTATAAEILLIPRIARRMSHEFEEYRPWVSMAQFDKEIGKYVDAAEVNRLKQYVFIPLDLNTATDDAFKTIPNLPANMLREFKEYRPWKTKAQFEKEIGKYVGPGETARLWRFMVIK
jgi:DNA uptake protein ComE-like DNA-binding protein